MNKTLIIWTEGGQKLGMGHFRRCLVIARQLRENGSNVLLLINDDLSLINQLKSESFSYEIASFSDVDCSRVVKKDFDIILIDTKRSIVKIVRKLRNNDFKIVLMDNITTARLESDIVIYPTAIFSKNSIKWDGFKGKIFGGADYVPIAKSFIETRQKANNLKFQPPYQILITMGGSDPNNLTYKTVSSLLKLSILIKIKVVIGPAFSSDTNLQKIEKQGFSNIEFIKHIKDISKLMIESHIAITAFGTTLFELAYMGVPSVVIANHKSGKEDMVAFGKLKIGIPLGYYEDLSGNNIAKVVEMFLEDRALRKSMSQKGEELIDGKGVERIASIIKGL